MEKGDSARFLICNVAISCSSVCISWPSCLSNQLPLSPFGFFMICEPFIDFMWRIYSEMLILSLLFTVLIEVVVLRLFFTHFLLAVLAWRAHAGKEIKYRFNNIRSNMCALHVRVHWCFAIMRKPHVINIAVIFFYEWTEYWPTTKPLWSTSTCNCQWQL